MTHFGALESDRRSPRHWTAAVRQVLRPGAGAATAPGDLAASADDVDDLVADGRRAGERLELEDVRISNLVLMAVDSSDAGSVPVGVSAVAAAATATAIVHVDKRRLARVIATESPSRTGPSIVSPAAPGSGTGVRLTLCRTEEAAEATA